EAPEVRLQLASTAGRLKKQDVLPLLHNLMSHKDDVTDPCLPLMIWLAYEPLLRGSVGAPERESAKATDTPALPRSHAPTLSQELGWLKEHAIGNPLVIDEIVPRTIRRLVVTGKPEDLAACVAFLGDVQDSAVRRKALEGFAQALQNRQVEPPPEWQRVSAELFKDNDKEVRDRATRLAVNFGDKIVIDRFLDIARDTSKPAAERVEAIRVLSVAHPAKAQQPLQDLLGQEKNTAVCCEACRALSAYNGPEVPAAVLLNWKNYPPQLRIEAVNLLAGRKEWAGELLAAVGKK